MKRSASQAGITPLTPPSKRLKQTEVETFTKQHGQSLFEMRFGSMAKQPDQKLAGFDMDWTLIQTRSGRTFAANASDWKFLFDETPSKLAKLHDSGHNIVVFTNQGGVASGNVTINELQTKFKAIQAQLDIPLTFLAAIGKDDKYRKPSTGMFHHYLTLVDGNLDKANSFYCGDAAGRPVTKDKKKDFSADDLKFANNIGLKFETPESCFLGQKQTGVQKTLQFTAQKQNDSGKLIQSGKPGDSNDLANKGQELVIFCGSPGAGKSTVWKSYFADYVRISNDVEGNKAKCLKLCQATLAAGKSAVIDNTNAKVEQRADFIKLAQENKVPVRCIWFDISKETCMHNNFMRAANVHREHLSKKVPSIAIHTWFKYFEQPTIKEGFTDVVKINFVPSFVSAKDEEAYRTLVK